jgi:two-component system response regulator RegA
MTTEAPLEGEKTLLILDDDAPFRTRLARALETRGFEVTAVGSVAEASDIAVKTPPA